MLTKIAAVSNVLVGMLWLLGELWVWMVLGGFSGVFNSARAFSLSMFFISLYVAGPLCLIIGSKMGFLRPQSVLSLILNLVGLAVMVGVLGPALCDNIHPAPLMFVDIRLTIPLIAVISLTGVATLYLVSQFMKLRKQIPKVPIDAA